MALSVSTVTFAEFEKIDIRAGRVIRAEPSPKARKKAFRLWLDFGELGIKQSSAQITRRYSCEKLVGRMVLAVVNFPPKQIADFISEVLVLGAVNGDDDVVLVAPDCEVPVGTRVQ
ncbi:tRNA-binding protein [Dehalogenimonas sp. THU2]|uniref:tRNA-binding protein n=1 Tax=Dehalogenimonas sp. THU2 TaxID=3151121 RepID=UPI003218728D